MKAGTLPSKKPKITVLASNLCKGGASRAIFLTQLLQSLEYETELVGFLFGDTIYPQPPASISYRYLPGSEMPHLLSSAKKLFSYIRGDIIYTVKPVFSSLGMAFLKRMFSNRLIVADIDDWVLSWRDGTSWRFFEKGAKIGPRTIVRKMRELKDPFHPFYHQRLEKRIKKVRAVTVTTQFLKKKFGGTLIPNGVDTKLFDPDHYDPNSSRKALGLLEYKTLFFPGAPRPHKGLEDLLAAFELLNAPNLRLVIVGGNPYDDYDDQLVEKWGKWIIQLPRIPVQNMPNIISAADIMVAPQRVGATSESQFPHKITEGMAMSKPVLSTRVGDIPDIVGETGYLTEPGNPQQMADAIDDILSNPERSARKGQLARKRCIERYSLPVIGKDLDKVFKQFS